MTFTSYAQNLEDVLLRRALRDVEVGHYIDVGAGDPEIDSVTKAFYDLGWSGINIEPHPSFGARLAEERSRDVNVVAAASDAVGVIDFFEVVGYGELSTTVAGIAAEYDQDGRQVEVVQVPTVTLSDVCREHELGDIHFLKVDVEGAEESVLRGADLEAFRPWIVLVEAVTFGRETDPAAGGWVTLLENARYREVYFDGLNRFYVAQERFDALAAAFEVPVNVRDDYRRASASRAERALDRLGVILGLETYSDVQELIERTQALFEDRVDYENRAVAAERFVESSAIEVEATRQFLFERERYVAWLTSELQRARFAASEDAAGLAEQLAQVLRSTSWRVTTPLRALRRPRTYLRALIRR